LFSIVDLHAITLPHEPATLRSNILGMTASLLACGVDHTKAILFLQSDVKEHASLCWVLGTLSTMPRLYSLPQFRDKSQSLKEVPFGLFAYPVLQSADILLYKATDVPVGEDNLQNIYFAQHLARVFNHKFKTNYFRKVSGLVADDGGERVRSLRNPDKKMSKSDPDPKSRINITDPPEVIVEHCKKAVTDFTSEVTFEPESRPGVANLVRIHCLAAGITPEEAVQTARGLDTAKYKLMVADLLVEHLRPIREKYLTLTSDLPHLQKVLKDGAENAGVIAEQTWREVRDIVGLRI
jgi:tryptophanyl-tRNA synthetase